MRPGTMRSIDDIPGVSLGSATIPYLQAPAAAALRRAVARRGGTLYINSALRTLPQQYLLHQWYLRGRCGIALAARPGTSNHEGGLAIDIESQAAWRSALSSEAFAWLGPSDPVHFDFVGSGGIDIRSLSVLAFQRLWNRNHPEDRIAEDGSFGPSTEARLARAPGEGFARGATCGSVEPEPSLAAIEVYWSRRVDGGYELRALAPSAVVRVTYRVDGYVVASATRAEGPNFPASYTFSSEGVNRLFEVVGQDASGATVALGNGAIDVTAGTAVYVKQLGAGFYEIGLERAPSGVAAIEVDADGFALTDGETGARRSTRLAVRSRFTLLGERRFTIRTYGSTGTLRGTLRRTLELR